MKVLQLIDSLHVGGAEVLAVNIANGLQEQGVDSYLCATRSEGILKESIHSKVRYLFLKRKRTLDFSAIFKLKRLIKENNISIIHAHSTSLFLAICIKILHPNIKILWHNHSGAYVKLSGLKLTTIRFFSKFVDYIISVNEELEVWSKKVLKHQKGSYIQNFPAFNNTSTITSLKGENGKRIVCLAGLKPVKNHLNLLRAFLIVIKKHPKLSLHLVGKDFFDDYSNRLKDFIHDNNLEKNVFFVGEQQDIKHILEQTSIGVLSSDNEGLPVALLEYGLANLPVLVTNVGGCKFVINNENALVDSMDSTKFAKKLDRLISDSVIREKVRNDLHQSVVNNYSKEKVLHLLISIYKRIVN